MKVKIYAVIIFCSLSFSSLAYTKISDPRLLNEMYNNCYAEYYEGAPMNRKQFSTYCKCVADKVGQQFTLEQLAIMELNTRNLNETQKQDALLANKKMGKIIKNCVSRVMK